MNAEKWPPLDPGTRVRTVAVPDPPDDWTEEAKATRRFGITGIIVTHHDSHGLCYDVRHDDDGTKGCYEPQELEVLPEKPYPAGVKEWRPGFPRRKG